MAANFDQFVEEHEERPRCGKEILWTLVCARLSVILSVRLALYRSLLLRMDPVRKEGQKIKTNWLVRASRQ